VTRYICVRPRWAAVLAIVLAAAGLAVAPTPAASAAPPSSAEPIDDEGGTKSLTDQLEASSRGYLEAKEALAASTKRQQELAARLKTIDAELAVWQGSLAEIVRQSYRTGRLGPMTAVLGATSPDSFLARAMSLDIMAAEEDRALHELTQSKAAQQQAKTAIDGEVRTQQKQLTTMAKRKAQAENALTVAKVGGAAAGGGTGSSDKSASAPRNPDGSLPSESCTVNDPTTSGCITPRTLRAMNSAKADGFTRFVSCFRPSGSGEHPRGRACDFAADTNGFGGVATGSSKTYGNRLADYFINNSTRLGVLYVIWFKRIWLPSSGWRAYTRGNGDPASDHTNHVHLSMR
jgi:hypothetical protein